MAKPRTLVITGYGINCDEETRFAFEYAGAEAVIMHINDIIDNPAILDRYQIVSFPGGFSYGDDTGSGKALASRIKNNLMEELRRFIERDTLMLGICNGFQVMVHLGILPALERPIGEAQVALIHNGSNRYQCRWVDLTVEAASPSVFTRGLGTLHIPVAHGEGNFYAPEGILETIEARKLVTMRYVGPAGAPAGGEFPHNPNGSINDIASICDGTGRIMGMMPHPERGMFFSQRDDWTLLREEMRRHGEAPPELSDGVGIFMNAAGYFS
ncbi:MAG: phosphoribosylformylglycinamidine synthase I [Spirochaetes bacterium]|nr:phosphoribosylformylglycinamidine synthase I [Spirochaetota bacterium]